MLDETAVHIIGGGIGGTVGAVMTCPLEVIKVRLQSSQGSELRASSPKPHRQSTCIVRRILSIVACSPTRPQPNVGLTRLEQIQNYSVSRYILTSLYARRAQTNPSCQLSVATVPDQNPFVQSHHTGFRRSVIIRSLLDIGRDEGIGALFKGLMPTLIGVLPTRGVYFCAYHKGQVMFGQHLPTGSSGVYLCAAVFGSISSSTLTNPIWFVKTRLQLDSRPGLPRITVGQVIRNTWHQEGIRGFYRGVSASYVGSLETALNFVIYENIKSKLLWWELRRRKQAELHSLPAPVALPRTRSYSGSTAKSTAPDLRGSTGGSKLSASSDMVFCMMASACSKVIAITALYPHEVVRTRLRETSGLYRGFLRTLLRVGREEGLSGLYRGMGVHYIRQVPNSCIMIGTYEFVVFLLQSRGIVKGI
ncbi:unnamed protein product [Calicophoron daubneyi]|uniref:Mitochondrial carrier protein n=1 Tax=Calicophoron daubneyi TaxID=300641 RepID=A0AAV2TYS3_CALDB